MRPIQQFLHELRRRKVVRTAALYFGGAFAFTEAVSLLSEALRLPDWTLEFAVIVVLAGFPLAMALAWVYDITREGIVRHQEPGPGLEVAEETTQAWVGMPALAISAVLIGVAIIASFLLGGWLARGVVEREAASGSHAVAIIAVLAFENLDDDPSEEYFGVGLATELASVLGRLDGVMVVGQRSARSLQAEGAGARRIGRELGVQAVLEGSFRRLADEYRIDAQLIDAREGIQLWSEVFARPQGDVFAVQRDIARSIAGALRTELGVEPGEVPAGAERVDAMAYDKYLWGVSNLGRGTEEGIRDAIDNFEAAVTLDSSYAPAHAGLANGRLAALERASGDRASVTQNLVLAERSARLGVRLAPHDVRARVALGQVHFYRFEWEAAEAEYVRALELDPDDPSTRQRYAMLLTAVGRIEDALVHARRAVQLDPRSPDARSVQLAALRAHGQFDEAIAIGQEILLLDRLRLETWLDLSLLFLFLDRPADASDALERYAELMGVEPSQVRPFTEAAEPLAAGVADWQSVAQRLEPSPLDLAILQNMAGDRESALSTLARAHRDRPPSLAMVAARPELRSLQEHPRFRAILADLQLVR
jgi:serine/threonine-protein kinase